MRIRWLPIALAAMITACAAGPDRPATPANTAPAAASTAAAPTAATPAPATPAPATSGTSAAPTPPASLATEIEDWKARAGDHFTASGTALEEVSRASAAEDESGLWSGCQRLHDATSIGLQDDLPTPDATLTAELQKMIDDMNNATHACLRFVLNRQPVESDNYREYLARAIEHLQRAKIVLSAIEAK